MEVKFKKLHNDAVLPSYANPNDAGMDLKAVSFTQEFDKSGKLVLVYHTGLAAEIPQGYMGLIFMRSSVSQKSLCMTNCVGIVDCDYKGEILVKFKIIKLILTIVTIHFVMLKFFIFNSPLFKGVSDYIIILYRMFGTRVSIIFYEFDIMFYKIIKIVDTFFIFFYIIHSFNC